MALGVSQMIVKVLGDTTHVKQELYALNGQIASFTASVNATAATTSNVFAQAGTAMQTAGVAISQTGAVLTRNLSIPLAIVSGLAVKTGIDFEAAFAGVRKTVDENTDSAKGAITTYSDLKKSILDISSATGIAQTNVAGIMQMAGQLGIRGNEAIAAFTNEVAKLGITTGVSTDQLSMMLGKFTAIMGTNVETQIAGVSSVITALGNTTATTEDAILKFGVRLAAAGRLAGVSEQQILAISAAAESTGTKAERGGTALTKIFMKMQSEAYGAAEATDNFKNSITENDNEIARWTKALEDAKAAQASLGANATSAQMQELSDTIATATEQITVYTEANDALKDVISTTGTETTGFANLLGMTSAQFKELFNSTGGATQIFELFINKIRDAGMAQEDVTAIMKDLGLTDTRLVQAVLSLAQANGTLNESTGEFEYSTRSLTGALKTAEEAMTGLSATDKEVGKFLDTTSGQFKRFKEILKSIAVTLTDDTTGALKDFLKTTNDLLEKFAEKLKSLSPEQLKAVTNTIIGLIALGPGLSLFGGFLKTFGTLFNIVGVGLNSITAASPGALQAIAKLSGATVRPSTMTNASQLALPGIVPIDKMAAQTSPRNALGQFTGYAGLGATATAGAGEAGAGAATAGAAATVSATAAAIGALVAFLAVVATAGIATGAYFYATGASVDDVKEKFNNLTNSISSFGDNIRESIGKFIENLPAMMEKLLPLIIESTKGIGSLIVTAVDELLKSIPILLSSLGAMAGALLKMLGATLPGLGEMLAGLVQSLVTYLIANFPNIVSGLMDAIAFIIEGIAYMIPMLLKGLWVLLVGSIKALMSVDLNKVLIDTGTAIRDGIIDIVMGLFSGLAQGMDDAFPGMLDSVSKFISDVATAFSDVWTSVTSTFDSVTTGISDWVIASATSIFEAGKKFFSPIFEGIMWVWDNIIYPIISGIGDLIFGIISAYAGLLFDVGKAIFTAFKDGIMYVFDNLLVPIYDQVIAKPLNVILGAAGKILEAGKSLFTYLYNGIKSIWDTNIAPFFSNIWKSLVDFITRNSTEVKNAGSDLFTKLKEGIQSVWDNVIVPWFKSAADFSKLFKNTTSDMKNIGINIINGLRDGILSAFGNVTSIIGGLGSGIISGLKSVLGIKSPSRVMMGIGDMIGQGLAIGISDSTSTVANAAAELQSAAMINPDTLSSSMSVNGKMTHDYSGLTEAFVAALDAVGLNVYMDGKDVTDIVASHLTLAQRRGR